MLYISLSAQSLPSCSYFLWDMLFDMTFIADWTKIRRHRQHQVDGNTAQENKARAKWDSKIGDKMLVKKM